MAKKTARGTRGKIVGAAWKLFYEQGYEDTTVEEIIELSHTSKGSFYHYFDGKDALLSTLSLLFDEKAPMTFSQTAITGYVPFVAHLISSMIRIA